MATNIVDYLTNANWPGTSATSAPDQNLYTDLFKLAYGAAMRHQMQQTESVLSGTTMFERIEGYEKRLDRWNKVILSQRDRGVALGDDIGPEAYDESSVDNVVLVPQFWEFKEIFDFRDRVGLMRRLAPEGTYFRNVIAGFNRKRDNVIATAFDATVTLGDGSGTRVFPAANEVDGTMAKDGSVAGATVSKMNVAKLIEARHIIEANDGVQGTMYCAIHPIQVKHMLQDDTNSGRLVSADFNALRPLMSGEVTNFLGFTFKMTTEIPAVTDIDATSGGNQAGHHVFCYSDQSMVYGDDEMFIRQEQLGIRGYSWQFFHSLGLGAVRIDDNGVSRIPCQDADDAVA